MKRYRKAGIVACSNGLPEHAHGEMEQLKRRFAKAGIELVFSDYLYAKEGVRSGTAMERANTLMMFYEDSDIDVIFDVSGGDISNEVLPHLDYEVIAKAKTSGGNPKELWGYSDLTVLLNAIYAKTGNSNVLYQIRNLNTMKISVGEWNRDEQTTATSDFWQGDSMSGIVVGGNIRCLLKLAGTECFPDMSEKVLFLEALRGMEPQVRTYFSQLKQLGVFEKISGLYLGTFTQWEDDSSGENGLRSLVEEYVPSWIPVAKTQEIGHGTNSKLLHIGKNLKIS